MPNSLVASAGRRSIAVAVVAFAVFGACGEESPAIPSDNTADAGTDLSNVDIEDTQSSADIEDLRAEEVESDLDSDIADATTMDQVPDSAPDAQNVDDSNSGADLDVASDAAIDTVTDVPVEAWRSSLYPEDWAPAFSDEEGRFLHDFSYAGYRNGTSEWGLATPEFEVDVVQDYSADPTGATDSTAAIQAAIDAVKTAGGGTVYFPQGLYRVDGQLLVTGSNTVLRGDG
ncbi:MAG: hypothetical protein KC561_05930, partial [Myxococcales bacterium]|nr:hypothetical protein [Myxococcales bacterium]